MINKQGCAIKADIVYEKHTQTHTQKGQKVWDFSAHDLR